MKKYLKILIITLAIQIGWIAFLRLLAVIPNISSDILGYGFWLVFPLSIVIDIVLSIKWGKNRKEKLLCIFLMPTNYTWILLIWLAIWYFIQLMDAMRNFVTHWQ